MARETLLVVDDEPNILKTLGDILSDEGYRVETARSAGEGIRKVEEDAPEVVFLDVWLGSDDGLSLLNAIREKSPQTQVIVMSGHGTIETAVRAIKKRRVRLCGKTIFDGQGSDYGSERPSSKKPGRGKPVVTTNGREKLSDRRRISCHPPFAGGNRTGGPDERMGFDSGRKRNGKGIGRPGDSSPFSPERPRIRRYQLRRDSGKPDRKRVVRLRKGRVYGSHDPEKGKFEVASGGTLFLDEIGDMSLPVQAKVLRVLQEKKFQRVGGNRDVTVDVRVIAASNKNLEDLIRKREFRDDLFYRLNVIPVTVPPLRERPEDIPLLLRHFIHDLVEHEGLKPKQFSEEATRLLCQYSWPGNVRELRNLIERLLIMEAEPVIERSAIERILGNRSPSSFGPRGDPVSPGRAGRVRKGLYSGCSSKMRWKHDAGFRSVEGRPDVSLPEAQDSPSGGIVCGGGSLDRFQKGESPGNASPKSGEKNRTVHSAAFFQSLSQCQQRAGRRGVPEFRQSQGNVFGREPQLSGDMPQKSSVGLMENGQGDVRSRKSLSLQKIGHLPRQCRDSFAENTGAVHPDQRRAVAGVGLFPDQAGQVPPASDADGFETKGWPAMQTPGRVR